MSENGPEKLKPSAFDFNEAPPGQPGRSRHEFWKLISEQARQEEKSLPVSEPPRQPELAARPVPPFLAPVTPALPEPPLQETPEIGANEAQVHPPACPALEPETEVGQFVGSEPPSGEPPQLPAHPARPRRPHRLPKLHFGSPLWTIASILSLTVNLILILVLIFLAREIFGIKNALQNQLINGLYNNFTLMDQASIKTTIPIHTSVPAKFNLPLNTVTTVVLQKDVLMKNARVVSLTTGGLTITNAPADITLPKGTSLPVSLNLVVPVDQQIPVDLNVVVDIPLNQTELHAPFVGLQNVVSPYKQLLDGTPDTLRDAVCGQNGSDFCKWLIP